VGSCEEYGPQPGEAPLAEDTPPNPISPYAVSKVTQTLLCRQYARSFDLSIVVARAFSHTGPGQDTRFAFPSFARQIAAAEAGRGPDEVVTGDLSAVRDFLDVRDVVAAYRLLVARGAAGAVYNVCSGRALTIREGLEILVRGARRPVTIRTDRARSRPADTPRLVGDNTKLRRDTGWRPERGIEDALLGLLDEARREFA
jgi:GDP-4-dehydro-6-deoxy-D-mannose reductase